MDRHGRLSFEVVRGYWLHDLQCQQRRQRNSVFEDGSQSSNRKKILFEYFFWKPYVIVHRYHTWQVLELRVHEGIVSVHREVNLLYWWIKASSRHSDNWCGDLEPSWCQGLRRYRLEIVATSSLWARYSHNRIPGNSFFKRNGAYFNR